MERGAGVRRWMAATAVVTVAPFVVAIALAPSGTRAAGPALAWLIFVGTSVHVASTFWLYSLPEVAACLRQSPGRYVVAPLVLITAAAVAAFTLSADEFAWVLVPFLSWQLFHFQRQNLGLTALAARATKARGLDKTERRLITACGVVAIAGLLARPERLDLHVDPGVHWLFPIAAIAYVAAVVAGVVHAIHRHRQDEDVVAIGLLGSCAFFAPVFLFGSSYAAVAGLTVAHGLQYLVLLGLIGAARQRTQLLAGAALVGVALLGGALLHQASHLHDSGAALSRALFGAYLGIVMAHFVIDAGLWRLRDPRAARFVSAYLPELVAPRPGGD